MFYLVTHKMLFRSLVNMINWTKSCQVKYKSSRNNYIPKLAWAKEYATVKFGVSRNSGHSSFAVRLIEKYENPVLFLPNMSMFCNIYKGKINQNKVGIVGFDPLQFRFLKKVDIVIVDCYSLFSKNEIDKIYETFVKYNLLADEFIFLFLE